MLLHGPSSNSLLPHAVCCCFPLMLSHTLSHFTTCAAHTRPSKASSAVQTTQQKQFAAAVKPQGHWPSIPGHPHAGHLQSTCRNVRCEIKYLSSHHVLSLLLLKPPVLLPPPPRLLLLLLLLLLQVMDEPLYASYLNLTGQKAAQQINKATTAAADGGDAAVQPGSSLFSQPNGPAVASSPGHRSSLSCIHAPILKGPAGTGTAHPAVLQQSSGGILHLQPTTQPWGCRAPWQFCCLVCMPGLSRVTDHELHCEQPFDVTRSFVPAIPGT